MITSASTDQWIIPFQARPTARLRVFCLPYAGGGASLYRPWSQAFPETIEVCAVQLPGREQYIARTPFTRLPPLVEWLTHEISPWLDRPYLFFGHSMGALISFELTRRLRDLHKPQPELLCASGARAPHIPNPHAPIHHLDEATFWQQLQQLEGTPAEVLANSELMQLLQPLLRADFAICETYTPTPDAPLACPIAVFGGKQDQYVSYPSLMAWRQYTQGAFSLHMFEGNHFFLHTATQKLLQIVLQHAEQRLNA